MDDQQIQQDVNQILQKILGPNPQPDTPTPNPPTPTEPPTPTPPQPPMPPMPPTPPQPPMPTTPEPAAFPPAQPVTPVAAPVTPAPMPFPEPTPIAAPPLPPAPVAAPVVPPAPEVPPQAVVSDPVVTQAPPPPAGTGSVFEGQGMGKYKVVVIKEKCIGAASCVAVAPKAFKLNSEQIAEVLPTVNQESDENLLLAAQSCPTLAIEVYDTTTGEKVWPK